jgi:hypothetical protein
MNRAIRSVPLLELKCFSKWYNFERNYENDVTKVEYYANLTNNVHFSSGSVQLRTIVECFDIKFIMLPEEKRDDAVIVTVE